MVDGSSSIAGRPSTPSTPVFPVSTKQSPITQIAPSHRKAVAEWHPCNPKSSYHDLTCGHRIHSLDRHNCGPTCTTSSQKEAQAQVYSFVCKQCVVEEVGKGLGIFDEDDEQPFKFDRLEPNYPYELTADSRLLTSIAGEEIEGRIKEGGFRDSQPVPMFDCVGAFLKKFPEAKQVEKNLEEMTEDMAQLGFKPFPYDLADLGDVLEEMQE